MEHSFRYQTTTKYTGVILYATVFQTLYATVFSFDNEINAPFSNIIMEWRTIWATAKLDCDAAP